MTIMAIPAAAAAPDLALPAQQRMPAAAPEQHNLADYLAASPGTPSGAGPGQVAQEMIGNLKGFFDRSQSMASRAHALADPTPPPHASMTLIHRGPANQPLDPGATPVGPQPAKGSVDGQQMDRVIQALGLMFDYSIETQLVVRGATQISGSANTLLRGQ